ncbi:S41 family peptidase [Streptosporangium sandarakinum]|uniref:S41 family peptidase n=1 Tax=Streptosporangium sandarakinum TaxID=1260955 RepID=UPI00341C4A10
MSGHYLRFPHCAGDAVVFTARDEVWRASLSDGRAEPLSADGARVAWPRLSPDGSTVAWTSWQTGHPEVFAGSRRLTFWSHKTTRTRGWSPDGDLLAISAVHEGLNRHTWAYAISPAGRIRRLPYGPVGDLAMRDGAVVLLSGGMSREPAYFKRYRGGTNGRLWVAADGQEFVRVHADLRGHFASPMLIGERLAFLSDHEGVGNVYSSRLDGSDLTRHTHHTDFYARNATSDGARIVYQHAGELWILDSLQAEPRPLAIRLPVVQDAVRSVATAADLVTIEPDGHGRTSVVDVRGTIHRVSHDNGIVVGIAAEPGERGRLPKPLGDEAVVWVSEGEHLPELRVSQSQGVLRLAGGRIGRVEEISAAPDGSAVAVATRDGRLLHVSVPGGDVTEVAFSEYGPVTDLAFAPDSRRLAWSEPGPPPLRRIWVAELADFTMRQVTDGRFEDWAPVFTRDGTQLAFLSRRCFDPVHDQIVLDLSFPLACKPFIVRLSDGTMEALPVPEGRYSCLRPTEQGLAWLRHPLTGAVGDRVLVADSDGGGSTLEGMTLPSKETSIIRTGVECFAPNPTGRHALIRSQGTWEMVDLREPDATTKIDLSGIHLEIDQRAEWRQAYTELARAVRHDFWDRDMAGIDWDAVIRRYRPLIDKVATPDDFSDVLWEVVAELATSHAYVISPMAGGRRVGFLGGDVEADETGQWRITRILRSVPGDARAQSPLDAAGLMVGDVLLSIDGKEIDSSAGPQALLAGTVGKDVTLEVSTAGRTRRTTVCPIADEEALRYHALISERRSYVDELSGGRVGYLHLADMVGNGWAQFHRDMRVEFTKDALVMDLRCNQGGHAGELIVEKLLRRVKAWRIPRYGRPWPIPADSPRGPVIACVDENAGSDGEIAADLIRALGIGPIVGTRTWGGAVGFGEPYRLVDGTVITIPATALWLESSGLGMENHGIEPDIEVVVTPQQWATGYDSQLDIAVATALQALTDTPPARPPSPTRGGRRAG